MSKEELDKLPAGKNPWIIHSLKEHYNNPWVRLDEYQVSQESGHEGIYGVVRFHNLAIGIVALDEDQHIYLVGQYRFPFDQYSWEIPAGGGPLKDDPIESARRELQEETGIRASRWTMLQEIQLSNSVTDELGLIYLAQDLEFGEAQPTLDEDLSLRRIPLQEAFERIHSGELIDSLTIAGLLRLETMILRGDIKL